MENYVNLRELVRNKGYLKGFLTNHGIKTDFDKDKMEYLLNSFYVAHDRNSIKRFSETLGLIYFESCSSVSVKSVGRIYANPGEAHLAAKLDLCSMAEKMEQDPVRHEASDCPIEGVQQYSIKAVGLDQKKIEESLILHLN